MNHKVLTSLGHMHACNFACKLHCVPVVYYWAFSFNTSRMEILRNDNEAGLSSLSGAAPKRNLSRDSKCSSL